MALTVRTLRGLTDTEYEALKADAKALPFRVTIRIHRQTYAYGAVDVRPVVARVAGRQEWRWTSEQFHAAREFVQRHGLVTTHDAILNGENAYVCFGTGIDYLRKEC